MWIEEPLFGRPARAAAAALAAVLVAAAASATPPVTPAGAAESAPDEPSTWQAPQIAGEPVETVADGGSDATAVGDGGDDVGAGALGERSGLYVSLAAGALHDSEREADGRRRSDDGALLRPALLFVRRPSVRSRLAVAYAPEVERYESRSELDAVHHAAAARWELEATRRTRLAAGGSLLDGEDPGRLLGGALVALPRGPFEQAQAYAAVDHRWQRASLGLHLARTRTRFGVSDAGEAGAAGDRGPAAGLDRTEDIATLTLGRDIGPRTALAASWSTLWPERSAGPSSGPSADGTEPPALAALSNDPLHTLSLGLRHRLGDRLTVALSAGVLDDGGELSEIAGGELSHQGRSGWWRLRYDRSLLAAGAPAEAPGGGGLAPGAPVAALGDTLADTLSLGFGVAPAGRWSLEQTLWGARASLPGAERLESLAATTRLTVRVARRLGLFAEGELLEQSGGGGGTAGGDRYSRWRAAAGLVFGLGAAPSDHGARVEPAALDELLPGRRGG